DDLVGAAAVLRSIWSLNGQSARHSQLVPILLHRNLVLLEPPADTGPPPLQLLRVQADGLWGKEALEALRRLPVRLPENLHMFHSVTHNHTHRCPILPEVHQDHTGDRSRTTSFLNQTEPGATLFADTSV
ncbi:hypothetical protein GOODEAATRI_032766, partial [Goodea atripinnis]